MWTYKHDLFKPFRFIYKITIRNLVSTCIFQHDRSNSKMKPSSGKSWGHLYRLKDPTNEAGSKSSMSGVFCLLNLAAIFSLIEMHISSTPTFTINNIPTMSATPTCNTFIYSRMCDNNYSVLLLLYSIISDFYIICYSKILDKYLSYLCNFSGMA